MYCIHVAHIPEHKHVKFEIFSDSLWALNLIVSAWHTAIHPTLARVAQSLFFILNACACEYPSFYHVTSHSGHPWNELVDAVCTAISTEEIHASVLVSRVIQVYTPVSPYLSHDKIHFFNHLFLFFL